MMDEEPKYIFFKDIPMTMTLEKGRARIQFSDETCIEELEMIASLGRFDVNALGIGIDGEYRPVRRMLRHLPIAIENLQEHRSGFAKPLSRFYSSHVN